jgi:hypothetical protein
VNRLARVVAVIWVSVSDTWWCALQVRVTALDAFGGLPPLDERCFELFWAVRESELGTHTMDGRRTSDIKRVFPAIPAVALCWFYSLRNTPEEWHPCCA